MPRLIFTESYEKRAARFLRKHPALLNQYAKALRILALNPAHPLLRLHRLRGRLSKLHSVSINLSYRIVIHFLMRDEMIMLVDVGSHDEVY